MEYDGTDFAGFQWQKDQRTVQGELEKAIHALSRETIRVAGAGRTDAGVHALGQVVSFKWKGSVPIDRLANALNSVLARDVRVVRATAAEPDFHARFSALSRSYVYVVLNREYPSAILQRYAWHVAHPLDVDAMREGALGLLGEQDFAAWANSVAEVESTVRHVLRCEVRRRGVFVLVFMEANAFLHGMVRNVVGTLIEVGLGKRKVEDIAEITASRDRRLAGPTAPARGLCLVRVRY